MSTYNGKGMVLELQRMSTEDGPGIRTTVFLKGCTLKCAWCHNPESISPKPQVRWVSQNCIGCKLCEKACKQNALLFTDKGVEINRTKCIGCGSCTQSCPTMAMERMGELWSAEDLVEELVKDKVYFDKSGGGVTISGGETTMQHDFSLDILRRLKAKGVHTAIDTCGECAWERLEMLLPYADLVLYDLKEIDPVKHKEFTAADNSLPLENFQKMYAYKKDHIYPHEVWVRTPVIPDATATEENIRGIGHFIHDTALAAPNRWELCAFNNLCKDKYTRLGLEWKFASSTLFSSAYMEQLTDVARTTGVAPETVMWSGSVALEEQDSAEAPAPKKAQKTC